MKKLSKFCILSIIIIILSISVVSASDIDNDNIQSSIDDIGIQEMPIGKVSLNEEIGDQSEGSNFYQAYNENEEDNLLAVDEISNQNSQNNVLSAESSGNVHKISPSNYTKYFNNNGYVKTNVVKSGDIIDLTGNFNRRNFTFTIPCSITSSQGNAYLNNCVVQYLDVNSTQMFLI